MKNLNDSGYFGSAALPESLLLKQPYERQMLRFLADEYGLLSATEQFVAVFISLFEEQGHVSLPLDRPPREWGEILGMDTHQLDDLDGIELNIEDLKLSRLFSSAVHPAPFWLDNDRAAFWRLREYQEGIAKEIEKKSSQILPPVALNRAAGLLSEWFPAETEVSEKRDRSNDSIPDSENKRTHELSSDYAAPDWQKIAAACSLMRRFLIISGGPGTGKTTTIARLIRLHLELSDRSLRIELAAPTGKAAGRMGESLFLELEAMGIRPENYPGLPREARTIHRLLSSFEQPGLLKRSHYQTLEADLLIVDEASMIDLLTMHRLLKHLGKHTRLILIGDKNQLASVEAGSVFSDLCMKEGNGFSPEMITAFRQLGIHEILPVIETGRQHGFSDSIVYLTKSYRFGTSSGIGALAKMVNQGRDDPQEITTLLGSFEDLEHAAFDYGKDDLQRLVDTIVGRMHQASRIRSPEEMLGFWKQEIWLLALRRGLTGTDFLNRFTEERYRQIAGFQAWQTWFPGRSVMITENDYNLGIFNGDMGICLLDNEDKPIVYIESGSHLKRFQPEQIKQYRPACFLTVHKSQGSEFETVHLLLPKEDTPVLSKELIYTAITRAKNKFVLHGNLSLFLEGIRRPTVRF